MGTETTKKRTLSLEEERIGTSDLWTVVEVDDLF